MTSRSAPENEAHDVLAAEAFAVPAPDPALHHLDTSRLPADPSGIAEAHDVLAADEFAIPAPSGHAERGRGGARSRSGLAAGVAGAVGFIGAWLVRARRGR